MENIKKELMSLNIARLLAEYLSENKIYDIRFIDRILNTAIESKGLENYISNYEYNVSDIIKKAADYNGETKRIVIYGRSMIDFFESQSEYTNTFTEEERLLYMNTVLTQTLLHEVEHANQNKKINTEDNLEAQILRLCKIKDVSKIQRLVEQGEITEDDGKKYLETKQKEYITTYHKLYDYAPHERLAEIKSHQEIIDALGYIDRYSIVTRSQEIDKLGNVLRGYDDTFSPTITYLNAQGRNKDLKQFDWYSDDEEEAIKLSKERYSLKDRMEYGLPVDNQEYQFVNKILKGMTR
jgi:hypothetical protein